MNHSQILDKLSASTMVEDMQDDMSRLVFNLMCYHKKAKPNEWPAILLPPFKKRWNTVLEPVAPVSPEYSAKAWIALAVILHKNGTMDKEVLKKAISSIDWLNKKVVLSDAFANQSPKIKEFLTGAPKPLTRKPSTPKSITFYRPGDMISFEMDKKFYAGYIHENENNEVPIVEWLDYKTDHLPSEKEISKCKAKGRKYKDGLVRISKFAVYGLKNNPDPANQVHLICSNAKPPQSDHLEPAIGLFAMSDIFSIQKSLEEIFN